MLWKFEKINQKTFYLVSSGWMITLKFLVLNQNKYVKKPLLQKARKIQNKKNNKKM